MATKPAAAAVVPAKPAAAPAPAPAAGVLPATNGAVKQMPPPVHNLAVKSEVVPAGRRRQSVIAGGVTKTENLIDFTKGKKGPEAAAKADDDDEGPNFFVLVSETSLFAGVPNTHGAIDGPALMSKFNTPSDIVVDRNQQLFIADTDNARIRRINKQGIVSTVAAIGGGDGDIENFPHGLAFDQKGAMYILQSGLRHQIFCVAPGAGVSLLAGTDEKGHKDSVSDLLQASFNHPRATGVDSQNRIYICDKGNNAIRRLDLQKKTVITLLGPGGVPLDLLNPEGLVVDQYDDLFIADTGHHRIMKVSFVINPANGFEETEVSNYCGRYGVASYANGPAAESMLHSPTGLAIDKQNHLWICDSGNNCIRMLAHGAELMFTVSGKGTAEQEKTYNYPTSIALSYDAMYGAEMAEECPDAIRGDPTHPLYYSYITPVIFVADSASHCIRKIHTVMMASANALIAVCSPAIGANGLPSEDDYPMHNALAYGVLEERNGLMQVLLKLKPQLLQQRNKDKRIPLHIACLESATPVAGSISMDIIEKMLGMAQPNALSSIMCEDSEGRIPVSYALEKIQEHAMNIASDKLEAGEDDEPDVDNPDLPWDASRQLIAAMLSIAPGALMHPSCAQFTLHTLIASGVPLPFLKKFAQAIEDARDQLEQEGMREAAFTTMFELKAAALAKFANPFFVRDAEGKLPIHVAAAMHAQGTPVNIDVLQWLVLVSQLPPQTKGSARSERIRDFSLKNAKAAGGKLAAGMEAVEGHFSMFYACTLPRAPPPGTAPGAPQLHKPLHKIPKEQVLAIEYLLEAWPESILQNEAAGVLHQSPFQATSMKPASFLEWVFYHRSIELLEIFCKRMPQCLDRFVWHDTQDVLTPQDAALTAIGKDGRRRKPHEPGPNNLTMLHSAAKINDAELLEIILKNSANPFISDKHDKLPIDLTDDAKCRAVLQAYMDKDPRKPVPQMVTLEIGTQTDEDLAGEKKKQEEEAKRLAAKEEELKKLLEEERAKDKAAAEAEKARLEAELAAATAKMAAEAEEERARLNAEAAAQQAALAAAAEAEKARLAAEAAASASALAAAAEAEKARLAELEAQKDAARAELEARLKAEMEAEKLRLQTEAAQERERLAALEAERLAALEVAKEEEKKRAEHTWKLTEDLKLADQEREAARKLQEQQLAEKAAAELARLTAEAAAERERLAQVEAEREAQRKALEEQLRAQAAADAAAAAELQARLLAEAEAEKARLKAEAEAEKARLAALEAEKDAARAALEKKLAAEAEAERQRLAAEAAAELARLQASFGEKDAGLAAMQAQMAEAEARRDEARRKQEEDLRAADAAREAARLQLEADLKAAADAEKARIAAELEAEKARLAAIEAQRQAEKEAADAARKLAEEEAEERERLRVLKNTKLQEQRDASRLQAEAAEAAKKIAEDELARLKALLEATTAEKTAAEAAAAAAEAARLAAEADAEEARRRREHQWALNAEHEERLRKEQEAAIAARPPSAKKEDLGDLKRLKKKQSPAELAALARAQAAIEAAAAKRNAPKKILGFGSSTLKDEVVLAKK